MSKEEQRKVPVLRFKGFTDDWEQRKLKDEYQKISNAFVGTASPFYVEHGHFYLESNNIKNGQINHDHEVFINDTFYNEQRNKHLHTNDLVMVQSGHVGDSAVITKRYNNIAAHALIMFQNPKYSETSRFLNYYFQSYNAKKKISVISIGNTISHILASDMNKFITSFPKSSEQQKIATIFQRIQDLISLQQQKLSLIEKLRENISEHIFSPDIMKFKNIDPEFEIKKLSDISNIFIGLVTTMTKNYAKNGILLIRNSNIKENNFKFDNYIYLDSKFAEKNKNREMKIGDVVTVHTGDIGTSAVIEPKEENSIGFATITTRPNNKIINSYYLSDYLNTKKHKNWAVRMSTGDGRRNYNLKDFTRIRLNVPSLNYQIKIVALIKYLESFSKSEKKKINQLNSLKQFLLQNLFI